MRGTASYLIIFLEGSQKRFIIPVYQRNYDWKKENCKQLFDDLVSVIHENKQSHFFGSIVSYSHHRDEIVLIDGQQRITTVSLIMIAILNALKKGDVSTDDATLQLRIEDFLVDKYDRLNVRLDLNPSGMTVKHLTGLSTRMRRSISMNPMSQSTTGTSMIELSMVRK